MDIYKLFPKEKKTTVRGRIYRYLGKKFERVDEGVYRVKGENNTEALAINGCSRNLEKIKDSSIDMIYADHPWSDVQHKGGNKAIAASYREDVFRYTPEDFEAKYRVLKTGGWLVENLPEENERNWEYLYDIKKMAMGAGFKYYANVPWKKVSWLIVWEEKRKTKRLYLS